MPSLEGIDDDSPPTGYGVYGTSNTGSGVIGKSNTGSGVIGESQSESRDAAGVSGFGLSDNTCGVYGQSDSNVGVYGKSNTGDGLLGQSDSGYGVYAVSNTGYGLYARGESGLAADLEGNVTIRGTLQKGGGSFKIDHPLDPANKYLSHSFVESPDMKNVYDGVVTLDDKGEADIELPDWFGALNKDFRYQLTAIGAPGPNLHISEEISSDDVATTTRYSRTRSNKNKSKNKSHFKIAGGASDMKVSWQVTGIRKDPWANAHRISVEEDKPAKERGYYTYPELYGQPEEKGISQLLFPREEEKKELLLLINDQNKLTT
jgi:hypothetical protein